MYTFVFPSKAGLINMQAVQVWFCIILIILLNAAGTNWGQSSCHGSLQNETYTGDVGLAYVTSLYTDRGMYATFVPRLWPEGTTNRFLIGEI